MSNKKIKVGIGSRNYSYRRVAYDVPIKEARFRKVAYAPWKLISRQDPRWSNTYLFQPFASVDLFHLWNGICLNRKPWITSFEADLPRYCGRPRDRLYDISLRRIHSGNCKYLLALSDFARHRFLLQNDGLIDERVRQKTQVLYGAVEPRDDLVLLRSRLERSEQEPFQLSFVGHDFFRKGGIAVLQAFHTLRAYGLDCRLTIVSGIASGDYVTYATDDDATRVKAELRATPCIDWRPSASHAEVLQLLAASDLCLLPTLDDTLGWSVLEAQSVGVPVLTTNVCAMPELVTDGVDGVQINLPLSENRRWSGLQSIKAGEKRSMLLETAYHQISSSIVASVEMLASNRNLCIEMGTQAIKKVASQHGPNVIAERLGGFYRSALELN